MNTIGAEFRHNTGGDQIAEARCTFRHFHLFVVAIFSLQRVPFCKNVPTRLPVTSFPRGSARCDILVPLLVIDFYFNLLNVAYAELPGAQRHLSEGPPRSLISSDELN